MRFFLLFFVTVAFGHQIFAQNEPVQIIEELKNEGIESFTTISKIDPKKAAVFAAVLPGFGKIYNKQPWKLPIVYGGFILFGHYLKYNNNLFHTFKNAYIAQTDTDPNTINDFPRFGADALKRNAEAFRRNRDLVMIFMGVFYLVNIAESHIAAHLREFNVNDDLAFKIVPSATYRSSFSAQSIGLSIVIPLNK